MKNTLKLCICLILMALAVRAQETRILGGELLKFNALPPLLNVTMVVGEERSFSIEESPATGYMWSVRPQNASLQSLTTHQSYEGTGGVIAPSGAATVKFIGNIASDSMVDLVLARPFDLQAAPLATVRCHVIVALQAAPVVVQPTPIIVQPQPIVVPPAPPRRFKVENNYWYALKELPPVVDAKVRRDGGTMYFMIECEERAGFEWVARHNDHVQVIIDNDAVEHVHILGHKNRHDKQGAKIEITGFNPGRTRLTLEYRKVLDRGNKHNRPAPPLKVLDIDLEITRDK